MKFLVSVLALVLAKATFASPVQEPRSPYLLPATETSPLVVAAGSGDFAKVKRLLQENRNPNEQECDDPTAISGEPCKNPGWTALMIAAGQGDIEIVRLLLSYGANPNQLDKAGHSPLWYAETGGFLGICRLLIAAGAQPGS